jgi:hypothetical protein
VPLSRSKDKNPPQTSESAREEAARRKERLAVALRENLRKRKDQSRSRAATGKEPPEGSPEGDGA